MKRVVVTGASKGIGRAIAHKFATEGYAVAVCARHQAELDLLADEFENEHGSTPILTYGADLAKHEDRLGFFEYIHHHWGHIDILVNNAGVFIPGQIHNEAPGVFEQTMELNINSAYHLTRMFLPEMMRRKSGHIFNMCSTASIVGYPNGGSYCISKFALYGMTKVLREELKPHNIKVTAILPGATFTASWQGTDLPEDRFMNAADVAESIFMAAQLSAGAVVEEILMRPQLGDIG